MLGGSWVVISGVLSRVAILITHTRGLIALLITTHEPPSSQGKMHSQELLAVRSLKTALPDLCCEARVVQLD